MNQRSLDSAWAALLSRVNDDADEWDSSVASLFERVDTSGDGKISVHELGEAIHALGVALTSEQVVLVFDDIDFNLDGTISYKEFVIAVDERKAAVKSKRVTNRTRIEQAWDLLLGRVNTEEWDRTVNRLFGRLDEDGSGMLDSDELAQHLHSLGSDITKDEMTLFFDESDYNLDGKLSRQEFMAAVDKRKPSADLKAGSSDRGSFRDAKIAEEK